MLPATFERIRLTACARISGSRWRPDDTRFAWRVRESVGGQAGSVFYDLQVPDFRKDPVMVSGLLLTSVAAQQTLTAQHDAEAEKLLPAPATTRREFSQSDVLAVLADIYDNTTSAQPRMIDVAARLWRTAAATSSPRTTRSPTAGRTARRPGRRSCSRSDSAEGRAAGALPAADRSARPHARGPAPAATETVITVTP